MGFNQLLTLKGSFIYMPGINPSPQANSTVGPEAAIGKVTDVAQLLFGVVSGITTTQGDVDAITLDLLEGDTATDEEDIDFRGSAYSVQTVLINSALGIQQRVYLQTDASRLAQLGSLSSQIFQAKYSELNRVLVTKLSQNKITETEFKAAQEAMLRGGAALSTLIETHDEVVGGKHTLKGFRDLPGIYAEPAVIAMLNKQVAKAARPERDPASVTASERQTLIDGAVSQYITQLDAGDLLAKLSSKQTSPAGFLLLQRGFIDSMLKADPLESTANYINHYRDVVEGLFNIQTTTVDANMSWEDIQSAADRMTSQITAGLTAISNFRFNQVASDYDVNQIDDGNESYGIDTDINTAARIFDGRVFEGAGTKTPLQQVIEYISSRLQTETKADGVTPLTEAELKSLRATINLSIETATKVDELEYDESNNLIAGKVKINLTELGENLRTIPNLTYKQHYYYTDVDGVGKIGFGSPAPAGKSFVLYQGLYVAVSDPGNHDAVAREVVKATLLEQRIQSATPVVFKDQRTIADVINGNKALEGKSFEELSELEKLFAGTNRRAQSLKQVVNEGLNTTNSEFVPLLDADGNLRRNTVGTIPLINSLGQEVSVINLQREANGTLKLDANGNVLDRDNNPILARTTDNKVVYTLSADGKSLVRGTDDSLIPLINSKGLVVEEENLKRDTAGQLVVPLEDADGNKIKIYTENFKPVFAVKTNTEEVKQQMIKINGVNVVVNSVELNAQGEIMAPSFVENLWTDDPVNSSQAYIIAGDKKVIFDKASKTITAIEEAGQRLNLKKVAAIKIGGNHIFFDYRPGSLKMYPNADLLATAESKLITVGDAEGKTKRVINLGSNGSAQYAVLADDNSVAYFISIDDKGVQKEMSHDRSHIILDQDDQPISLVDSDEQIALAKLDMKRVNHGTLVYALEDNIASKKNAESQTAKLPEPRSDGVVPVKPLPPPALAPTGSSMIIARIAREIAERVEAIRNISIDASKVVALKTDVDTLNTELSTTLSDRFRTYLQGLATAATGYSAEYLAAKAAVEDAIATGKDEDVINAAKQAFVTELNRYSTSVVTALESSHAGSLEDQAKQWLESADLNLKGTIDSVQEKVNGFSEEINVFNANLLKTFGARSSDRNIDSKQIRELIMLLIIFSSFESSAWDSAQSEADATRYQVEDTSSS